MATEHLLKQDDPRYSFQSDKISERRKNTPDDNLIRITRYNLNRKNISLKNREDFIYRYERGTDNGVSEVLSLGEDKLLIMERGYDSSKNINTVKIFEVNLKGAHNVASQFSIANIDSKYVLKKKLLLDLKDVQDELNAGFRKIDNFEAMALGPSLKNGKQSLILATDNNFRKSQLTQVLLLQLPYNYVKRNH